RFRLRAPRFQAAGSAKTTVRRWILTPYRLRDGVRRRSHYRSDRLRRLPMSKSAQHSRPHLRPFRHDRQGGLSYRERHDHKSRSAKVPIREQYWYEHPAEIPMAEQKPQKVSRVSTVVAPAALPVSGGRNIPVL